ncbi:hypothetical protein GY45DRAFT_118227 [Cubamyces sp. BRFM 1775]|nr:hypothetical protein GY45DRAFT_118227 [Cubamyces sp. BRFM 1775]
MQWAITHLICRSHAWHGGFMLTGMHSPRCPDLTHVWFTSIRKMDTGPRPSHSQPTALRLRALRPDREGASLRNGCHSLLGATLHLPVGLGRVAKGRLLARRPMAILGVVNGKLPFCAFSDRRSTRLSIASRRLTTRALGAGEGIRRMSRSP